MDMFQELDHPRAEVNILSFAAAHHRVDDSGFFGDSIDPVSLSNVPLCLTERASRATCSGVKKPPVAGRNVPRTMEWNVPEKPRLTAMLILLFSEIENRLFSEKLERLFSAIVILHS